MAVFTAYISHLIESFRIGVQSLARFRAFVAQFPAVRSKIGP